MKEFLLFLIISILIIAASKCSADNVGLDYAIGPNQIPSYGMDITSNRGYLYLDIGVMVNRENISPQISFGLQIIDVNVGIVSAANIVKGSISSLWGGELGYTYNLSDKYYIKDNNQLLRDNNHNGWFSSTLSVGFNF